LRPSPSPPSRNSEWTSHSRNVRRAKPRVFQSDGFERLAAQPRCITGNQEASRTCFCTRQQHDQVGHQPVWLQSLTPSMTYASPTLRATVAMCSRSEPAPGSVMEIAAIPSPSRRRQEAALLLGRAVEVDIALHAVIAQQSQGWCKPSHSAENSSPAHAHLPPSASSKPGSRGRKFAEDCTQFSGIKGTPDGPGMRTRDRQHARVPAAHVPPRTGRSAQRPSQSFCEEARAKAAVSRAA
jgi:hypothetical protein